MKKYMLTSANYPEGIICGFNGDGMLIYFMIEGNVSKELILAIFNKLPVYETEFLLLRRHKHIKVEIVPEDLSFERFYKEFDNKIGKKERSQKLWNALNENDKAKAIAAIKPYNNFLLRTNIQKVYPETYLSQRRFDNDFN